MRPRLKVAPESVRRFKDHIRELLRKGRGRSIDTTIQVLKPFLTGWMQYYKLAAVKGTFESLDEWLRRKLRRVLWKHWKKPRTRMKRLIQLGLDRERAHISAYNGRGPWWNAGASHMNQALLATWFAQRGLVSLLDMHRSFNKLL
ncbi:MAG: group II intron maturase-specific domain-containing protein [Syntrophorhabdales bacterium]